MDRNQIKKELDIYVTRVEKKFDPEKIILFGSFARGDATNWSDVDILVISQFKGIPEKKRFDILYDLHTDLIKNHDINVYGITPQEYANAKPWTIFSDIKEEGILLYQKTVD
ncbi:MAG TPA: nucleotidyltransferase domain-containing protein [Candidatus Woesebacteria bacterium]|nr:nucleotidyltransferase domain-containing protein [Candidatus Woesebacteria bacterium]